MVDSSTQTPRDEDSAKPEEEVIIEDAETTGAAPNIMEQDSKEGNLVLLYCFLLHLTNRWEFSLANTLIDHKIFSFTAKF